MNGALSSLIERAAQPGFEAWRRGILAVGSCTNPIHLVGATTVVDAATGEILHTFGADSAGGRLLTACGNRRASVCPTCSRVYKADTYHLIRAGLTGGKGIRRRHRRAPLGVRHPHRSRLRPGAHPPGTRRPGRGLPPSTEERAVHARAARRMPRPARRC